jgi:molecular chaperone GrpE (heat shock protein)
MGVVPATPEHAAGTVVAELRKGYAFHDRVLRPARVHIAMAPRAPEGEQADGATDD